VAFLLLFRSSMKIRNLVFATDFSRASETAGQVAREGALEMGARLHIVHVVPAGSDPAGAAVALTEIARRLGRGLVFETALLAGRAAHEIVSYARDKRVDMIVIGTHGRTGLSRRILGSVAEAVVRLSPCLVLTVPFGYAPEGSTTTSDLPLPAVERCIVCAGNTDDLICAACRDRIRGEALERKLETERAGRRGAPA